VLRLSEDRGAATGDGGLEARPGGRLPERLWPSLEAREHRRGFAEGAPTLAPVFVRGGLCR
jgi:hypothetical protein